MRGLSYRAIGEELQTSHETVRKQLNSPEGQRILRQTREEYLDRTGRMMSSLGMIALQTLGQVLISQDSTPRDKIAAASKILDLQFRHTAAEPAGGTTTGVEPVEDIEWLKSKARRITEIITVEPEPDLTPIAAAG
jgi:hypothetical protein